MNVISVKHVEIFISYLLCIYVCISDYTASVDSLECD